MTKTQTKKTETVQATASATPAIVAAAVEKKVKAPKAPKTEATATAVVATTTATAAVATPSSTAEKKVKAPKTEKKKEVVATATAVSNEVVAPVEAVAAAAAVSVTSEFGEFMTKLQQLGSIISSLKTEFRSLEKKASRELKTAAKASHKRKRKTGNRSPSGFVKPTLISDELATFLGKSKGTEMARTEVTREINAYIRANSLQDKANGRRINADTKLSSLLKLASGEELTYFNLQRYMSPHFAKSSGTAAVAVASA